MRSPGKVAKILKEILIRKDIEDGMIYNIRRRSRLIPELDEDEKEEFRKACQNIIDPYIK